MTLVRNLAGGLQAVAIMLAVMALAWLGER